MSHFTLKRTIHLFLISLLLFVCTATRITVAQTAELVVQTGHALPVNFLAFSPDGRLIVSGDGQTTKLWDVATRRELRTLGELRSDYFIDYRLFRFTSDSRLATDGNRIIDLATAKELASFPSVVAADAFLSDDRTKFATTNGTYVRAWPLAGNGQTLFIYRTELAVMNPRRMLFASFGKPEKVPAGAASENANSNIYSSYGPSHYNNSNAPGNISANSVNGRFPSNVNRGAERRSAARPPDNAVYVYSIETEKQVTRIPGFRSAPGKLFFTEDGSRLITVENDAIKVWEVATGKLITSLAGQFRDLESLIANPDGTAIVYGIEFADERTRDFRLWVTNSGKTNPIFGTKKLWEGGLRPDLHFSPDGKLLLTSEFLPSADRDVVTGVARLLDSATGAEIKRIDLGRSLRGFATVPAVFSPDGRTIAVARNNEFETWDLTTGQRIGVFEGYANRVDVISLANDGTTIAATAARRPQTPPEGSAAEYGSSTFLWPLMTGDDPVEITGSMKYTGPYAINSYLMMSSAGQLINRHNRFLVTQVSHYKGSWEDQTDKQRRETLEYKVWDSSTALARDDISGVVNSRNRLTNFSVDDVGVSPDGSKACFVRDLSISNGSTERATVAEMWDVARNQLIWSGNLPPDDGSFRNYSVDFDAGGKKVTIAGIAFDVETGVPDITTLSNTNTSDAFEGYGRMRIGGRDVSAVIGTGRVGLLDSSTRELKAELYWLNETDWAVVTPAGLWDASPGARRLMHYVVGFEPISLEQTKAGYYLHDLLPKIFRGVPLPQVTQFSASDLFPEIKFDPPQNGETELRIKLRNRGGGIGTVQILINDKEFVADARPPGFDPRTPETELVVDFKNAPLMADAPNKIEVVARNTTGSLSSRGTPRGEAFVSGNSSSPPVPPNVYAIVAGIAEYAGDRLRLNYAAKDAEDFARTIDIGARKLVGNSKKVHIRLLTSNGSRSTVKFNAEDSKIASATKPDIEQAFRDFENATANDIFIVYFAGHGVSMNLPAGTAGATAESTYLYLTQEATTADTSTLRLENTRRAMTISGDELKDLMKKNRALKQVLVLDTCAAGNIADSFVAKRDTPADQVAALERLKDNTGFFILMGSASDAVSYEAGEYGQGLLTRALLQGMQGEKLRLGEYADVEPLFGYARDTVVELARNIGGIQRPETITPFSSRSFDIGRFTADERIQIKLPSRLPRILRPSLQNDRLRFDDLRLEDAFGAELRAYARNAGRGDGIVFIDAREVPDAIRPSGGYTVDRDMLTITIVLVRDNKVVGSEVKVSGPLANKDALLRQLVEKVVERARSASPSG